MSVSEVELKQEAGAQIELVAEEVVELSCRIQSHPETAYREVQAAKWVSGLLERHGFEIHRGIAGIDTAFSATCEGSGQGPTIALMAEYDALPDVGHGCGHNLIAAGAVGAALGLKAVMPRVGGILRVFGTPAEESSLETPGKVRLLEVGALEGVDLSIMFHPYTANLLIGSALGVVVLKISFEGKPAHAGADPWKGLNALDGVLLTYMGINALRQHVRPDVRIHGIVTHGGDAANVIPQRAAALFGVRSVNRDYLQEVVCRIEDCAKGAALATGTQVSLERTVTFENTLPNRVIEGVVKANLKAERVEFEEGVFMPMSTDFGNVSQRLPSYWFMLKTHRSDLNWHSAEVAQEAVSEAAHAAMLKGAKLLAMSCIDFFVHPDLVQSAREEFDGNQGGALRV